MWLLVLHFHGQLTTPYASWWNVMSLGSLELDELNKKHPTYYLSTNHSTVWWLIEVFWGLMELERNKNKLKEQKEGSKRATNVHNWVEVSRIRSLAVSKVFKFVKPLFWAELDLWKWMKTATKVSCRVLKPQTHMFWRECQFVISISINITYCHTVL